MPVAFANARKAGSAMPEVSGDPKFARYGLPVAMTYGNEPGVCGETCIPVTISAIARRRSGSLW